MEDKRPRMDDPAEYALIKSIYFKDDGPLNADMDPIERLERMESKMRFNSKSSR